MALILVLALISMTLGVSYALVRSQTSAVKVLTNARLGNAARQAAFTGLSVGMRRISQTSWGGVGSTITGSVNANETFSVTFVGGDSTLVAGSIEDADWPYRVTISATGYAVDPTAADVTTSYKVEAVARLVPMQTAANPALWNSMLSFVFYQTQNADLNVQLPLKIDGPMRWQGKLNNFCSEYPATHAQRSKYLTDLNAMRSGADDDYRPFTGPIVVHTPPMTTTNRNYLTSNLGITLTSSPPITVTNWSHPGAVSTYQLFPGGTAYNVPTLPGVITNTVLRADPRTNPAGVFYRSGDVTLGNNAAVVGTIVTSGNVICAGSNVSIEPHSLSPVTGTSAALQLPAVVCASQMRVSPGCDATCRGVVASFKEFVSLRGTQNTRFRLEGNLLAESLEIEARTEWDFSSFWWSLIWSLFGSQSGSSTTDSFPVYCWWSAGLQYVPQLTMAAPPSPPMRQWFTGSTPVYAVGNGDAGLVWSILRVTELR